MFDTCAKQFKQIFTINALIDVKSLPMVYALLWNKRQESYEHVFRSVSSALQNSPNFILTDFEFGEINAIRTIFPKTIIGDVFCT